MPPEIDFKGYINVTVYFLPTQQMTECMQSVLVNRLGEA